MAGKVTLTCEGEDSHTLVPGGSCVIPAGISHALTDNSDDLELLEVTLPADLPKVKTPPLPELARKEQG